MEMSVVQPFAHCYSSQADNPILVEALQEYHRQLCTNNKKISQRLLG
jgi:hypothetical protein